MKQKIFHEVIINHHIKKNNKRSDFASEKDINSLVQVI